MRGRCAHKSTARILARSSVSSSTCCMPERDPVKPASPKAAPAEEPIIVATQLVFDRNNYTYVVANNYIEAIE
jgi:hypothetical protein